MIDAIALPAGWQHRESHVNDVRLHYVEAGQGTLVLLLHGFPEFWYAWRRQIPALVDAGFRVIALDQRGYNTSEKPLGIAPYRLEHLVDDVVGIIRAAGEDSAIVVGHDWGGAIAWSVAMAHPEVVQRLVVLNGPHPRRVFEEFRTASQLLKSWYVFFFQLPWLPEWLLRRANFASLDRVLSRDPVNSAAFNPDDIEAYRSALAQPGALTATINYYRALFRRNPLDIYRAARPIVCPTLLIWGEQDRYLGLRFTEGLERWVSNLTVARIPEASHWVQADAPETVNALLLDFLHPGPNS
ncbi:alpha/beta fold hydrolase [Methylolobus aquaticus]